MKRILFKLIEFMKELVRKKGIYLLTTILVLAIGYILINKGYVCADKNAGNIYVSIGTSLIAAGIVAVLDIWRELIKDNIIKRVDNVIIKAGAWFIYRKRDLDRYDDLMGEVKRNIDITGYSLRSFYDSYAEIINKKVKNNPELKIRILVVDPDSEFSKNREAIEGNGKEAGIYKFYIEKMEMDFMNNDNVEIRRINSPLTTMIFRIDDVMFIGPHFYKKSSKSTLTFELYKKGWLFDEYEEEFQRLWKDGKTSNKKVILVTSDKSEQVDT